jgi:hypothetical protein
MKNQQLAITLIITVLLSFSFCKKKTGASPGTLQLLSARIGTITLQPAGPNNNTPVDSILILDFSSPLDTASARAGVMLVNSVNSVVAVSIAYDKNFSRVMVVPRKPLDFQSTYTLSIRNSVRGAGGESFPGAEFPFTTIKGNLKILDIRLNGLDFSKGPLRNIDFQNVRFEIRFDYPLDPENYKTFFVLSGIPSLSYALADSNRKVTVMNTSKLPGYSLYYFTISSNLTAQNGNTFGGFVNSFHTILDSTYKFPPLTDDQLLTLVQQQTFGYFYDFAHPASGMARERNTSGDVVTTGGSGFGVMALIVGMNRNFITRNQGMTQLNKILTFLETCDRFHGAWSHWVNGNTGKVVPFDPKDNGGDIVETSYMVMGLLTMRQYLDSANTGEKQFITRINALIDGIDWTWYQQGQNVLYWNWSPDYGFVINVKVQGYNETLITYVLAASSRTHPITPAVYSQGYARNGAMQNGNTYYGIPLPLGEPYGGPLFFTQYTYMGLDPRNLKDIYANYWDQNVNQSLINYSYCVQNPNNYIGYNTSSWGLTASDDPKGYEAHSPTNDDGTISPTAAVSALPFTPAQSMNAIKQFYFILGDKLWGPYGFYDAFDVTLGWWATSYLAIDEGPIVSMIENYRTQLLWNLFMSCPEVRHGLTSLGFTY